MTKRSLFVIVLVVIAAEAEREVGPPAQIDQGAALPLHVLSLLSTTILQQRLSAMPSLIKTIEKELGHIKKEKGTDFGTEKPSVPLERKLNFPHNELIDTMFNSALCCSGCFQVATQ